MLDIKIKWHHNNVTLTLIVKLLIGYIQVYAHSPQ